MATTSKTEPDDPSGAPPPKPQGPGLSRVATALCVLLALFTALVYVWNVGQWNFLGDDGYISFRYSKHLVQGQGLTWNPGERVEGYTNFLWVILLAGGMLIKIPPEILSRILGIASGTAVLLLLVHLGARRTSLRDPLVYLPGAALAMNRSFAAWSTGGLETTLFAALTFGGLVAFLEERDRGRDRSIVSTLLLAAATLTRPDGALFLGPPALFVAVDVLRKRRTLKSALIWIAPYIAIVGAHLLWRRGYYGYWLPNTFYAKVPGLWWEHGLKYLALFQQDFQVLWFIPLALLAIAARRAAADVLFGVTIALQIVYLAAVGGDRFEFRLLVPILAPLYWLFASGLRVLVEESRKRLAGRRAFAGPVAASAASIALIAITSLAMVRPEGAKTREGVASIQEISRFATTRADQGMRLKKWIDDGVLPGDVLLCTGGAGALPYYTDWPTVDYYGLNDLRVARMPITHRGLIGHERHATMSYIRERKVEMFDLANTFLFAKVDDKYTRQITAGEFTGKLRILKIEDSYLIFATTLPDKDFRSRFDHVEILQ